MGVWVLPDRRAGGVVLGLRFLLRWNSQKMNHFKVHLVHSQCCTIIVSGSKTFSSSPKETLGGEVVKF